MSNVFEQLQSEWRRLGRSRPAARQLPEVCEQAGDATVLADVETYVRSASPASSDHILLALVTRVVTQDHDLAARVLLQLLLPGTRSLARRWWALGDYDERAAAAVMAVYHRIRNYPLQRRPGRVAANILLDAARELRRSVPHHAPTLSSDPTRHLPLTPILDTHPAQELAEVLLEAVADDTLSATDAQLIARTRIYGDRIIDLAPDYNARPRTLWDRRQRAERALSAPRARP